ncbi:hypothetical protein WMF45_38405 [Sorangium sp. So ce448]|uniref:RCC1 domain-containing protein n=1 Tax=Sorangium sp. So ce448 TaxID=3133314 RepID=UPI003F61F447
MNKVSGSVSLLCAAVVLVACGGEQGAELSEEIASSEAPLSVAVALTVGSTHACSALTDGTAYCWGYNGGGELGDGTTTSSSSPVQVPGLSSVVDIAVNFYHSCAVAGGAVYCWGSNGYGKLGDGTRTRRYSPTAVSGLSSGVVAVTTGFEHSCALLSGGSIKCWGSDLHGQIGDSNTATDQLTPVTVSGITDAVAITAEAYSTCALHSTGAVSCWGDNYLGQLGDGTQTLRQTPVSVSGISTATAVTRGSNHTCALLSDATVKCWGSNGSGQLGVGSLSPVYNTTPVTVTGISDAVSISAGYSHVCVVHAGGGASCWGLNGNYQLGDGTSTSRTSPVSVSSLSNPTLMAGGYVSTCAAISGGGAKCWGTDTEGQLGNGGSIPGAASSTPVSVLLP